MRILTVLLFVLVCTSAKSDRNDQYTNVPAGEMDLPQFLEAIFTSDFVQNKIDNTLDLIDLKIHYIKLFKTLFTTENLILLRRTLEWFVSISNVAIQVLPDNPEKPITINTILNHIFSDEDGSNYIEDYVPESSSVFATIANLVQDHNQPNKKKYVSNVKDAYAVSHIVADKDQDYESVENIYTNPKTDLLTTERFQEVFTSSEKTMYPTAPPTSSTTTPSTTTRFTTTTSTTATPPTTRTTSTTTTGRSVTLPDEDLKLLKSYGLSQEEAVILANHIFQKNNEVGRYKRGGQQIQDRIVKRHGDEFSKTLSISQLIRGPQYRHY